MVSLSQVNRCKRACSYILGYVRIPLHLKKGLLGLKGLYSPNLLLIAVDQHFQSCRPVVHLILAKTFQICGC